jgi:hypothetical protein
MRWNIQSGIYCVGPFPTVEAANTWGGENEGGCLDWQTVELDPTVPLPVRAPVGNPPLLTPKKIPPDELAAWRDWVREKTGNDMSLRLPAWLGTPPEPANSWCPVLADRGAFHVLMTTSEPVHLVGPFRDHQRAYSWGMDQESRGGEDCDYYWQIVWMDDPTRPPVLRHPDGAVL